MIGGNPLLAGRTVVFLSCMDDFKEQLARPIRDQLNDLGYHAVIVMDEPMLRGSFNAESKVESYIQASDAFVALCTPDTRVPGGTAQNIIDEIGRARTHPRLRDVVCVLKDERVKLPSNIDPVWEALDSENPAAAFGVIRRQLNAWGVIPTEPRATPMTPPPLPAEFVDELFEGVGLGDHEKAEARLRELFGRTTKEDQHRVAQGIFAYLLVAPDDGNEVHIAASFLEACSRLDPSLVQMGWVEQLVGSHVVQHRMSAAMILWDLSETMAGVVPLDLIAKLARPSTEDWYVYSPALGAAKQLSLSRKSALQIIVDLASSLSADDRDAAISALRDLARVEAAIIPLKTVERLSKDSDSSVSEAAKNLLPCLSVITDDERRATYGKFGL
jgi:hypothetical protein